MTLAQSNRLIRAREARELKRKAKEDIQVILEDHWTAQEVYNQGAKEAQIAADAAKVAENQRKEYVRTEKRVKKAADISDTGKTLILDSSLIHSLDVQSLNRQLDWHRDNEKRVTGLSERVPLKSHMKNKADRVRELEKALTRYHTTSDLKILDISAMEGPPPHEEDAEITEKGGDDLIYASDFEDDMV